MSRLAFLVLVLSGPWSRAEDDRYAVKLTAYDQLVLPGRPLTLEAKLEHQGFAGLNPDMRGYPLRFSIPAQLDQEVRTGREGVAALSVRSSHGPNPRRAEIQFPGSPHHQPAEATARIFVWPADSPVLIVDIDHTVSDLRELDVVFTENARIPTTPGAAETLARLARRYRIVYLTARDHALYNKTRAWLEGRGFPDGPLFTRDFHLWESRGEFKRAFIAGLKKRFPNVAAGVGDCRDDARAYLQNGLRAVILDPAGTGQFPARALVAPSWRAIGAALAGEGTIPPNTADPGVRGTSAAPRPAPDRSLDLLPSH